MDNLKSGAHSIDITALAILYFTYSLFYIHNTTISIVSSPKTYISAYDKQIGGNKGYTKSTHTIILKISKNARSGNRTPALRVAGEDYTT